MADFTLTIPDAKLAALSTQLEPRVPTPQVPVDPADPSKGEQDDPTFTPRKRIQRFLNQLVKAELAAVDIVAANAAIDAELEKADPDPATLKTHLMARYQAQRSKA